MTDLISLAVRLEGATGPDRELDAEIAAVHPTTIPFYRMGPPFVGQAEWIGGASSTNARWLPFYTADLAAALTLVPEGYAFGAGMDFLVAGPPGWAWVTKDEDYQLERAATPALALSSAALRAHAAGEGRL